MRTLQCFRAYAILLLCLSTYTAAWPWPNWLPDMDALVVRDDTSTSTSTAGASSSQASETDKSTKTSNTASASAPSTSASDSEDSGDDSKGNSTTSASSKTTSYDARLPAGGVDMQTPAIISGSQFYKIGDYVTFGWNYTSLLAAPTAIDIMATCTKNSQLYTIAANQTFDKETGHVTWDTGAYQATNVQDPLLTETYTLIIYDADSSISATAQAGYLAVFNQYTFGMYTPMPYTPLADFQCVTCNGALGGLGNMAVGGVLAMSVVTVLSFTWFVGGTGVLW